MGDNTKEPLFKPLAADDIDQEPTEIESLCMNCYKKVNLINLTSKRNVKFEFILGCYTIIID